MKEDMDMELIITKNSVLESLQHMENLIEGEFADNDLAKARFAESRLANLLESQMKVKGFSEFLHFCEPCSPLFADEFCQVQGKIDDFLFWAKAELDIATKQL